MYPSMPSSMHHFPSQCWQAGMKLMMWFGMVFIYLPMILLIGYSFNDSRLVTVWGGFSTTWHDTLWQDEELIHAAITSIKIAAGSATLATILGVCAAFAMRGFATTRAGGALLFLVASPIILPEVVMGFGMLLLIMTLEHWVQWPSRDGMGSVMMAHTTLGMAYASMIIRARIDSLGHQLQEAALDLGASPWKVLWVITLPLIAPACSAGWLVAFTLSFDDLVLANFTTAPGTTTLPMVIYSRIRTGVTPAVNALCSWMIASIVLSVCISYSLGMMRPASGRSYQKS